MISLKSLYLQSNQLRYIPVSVGKLELENLELSNNLLEPIYHEFAQVERALCYIRCQKTIPKNYVEKRKQATAVIRGLDCVITKTPKIMTFLKLLKEKEGVKDFLDFTRSEYSSENLLFIMAVMRYKALFPSINLIHTDELVREAILIYRVFILEESKTVVNLSALVREGNPADRWDTIHNTLCVSCMYGGMTT
eukprot:TRINITY_DN4233_c0_g3_i1.p1 TRINITY_DN4233_c0_g3~~TRINITY_DN4233_c0_g3_i1.p1  ORF type:complete len:194 (-),score=31.49 TRINITY_DN4233_c0_g3_i1:421-1002(-)